MTFKRSGLLKTAAIVAPFILSACGDGSDKPQNVDIEALEPDTIYISAVNSQVEYGQGRTGLFVCFNKQNENSAVVYEGQSPEKSDEILYSKQEQGFEARITVEAEMSRKQARTNALMFCEGTNEPINKALNRILDEAPKPSPDEFI